MPALLRLVDGRLLFSNVLGLLLFRWVLAKLLPVLRCIDKTVLGSQFPGALAACSFLAPKVASRRDAAMGISLRAYKVRCVWRCAAGKQA